MGKKGCQALEAEIPHLILDMATSAGTFSQIMVAQRNKQPLPENSSESSGPNSMFGNQIRVFGNLAQSSKIPPCNPTFTAWQRSCQTVYLC